MSPTCRQTKRDKQKKHIFAPVYSRHAWFDLPKLCMVIEDVVPILKGVNHFLIQRIVLSTGVKMLILATDALSKFNTGGLPWQPAGN